jgi:hypothetical protein
VEQVQALEAGFSEDFSDGATITIAVVDSLLNFDYIGTAPVTVGEQVNYIASEEPLTTGHGAHVVG